MKKIKTFWDSEKGLTLAELMIAVTITSIIVVGVSTFFSRGIDFFRITEAKVSIQRDARQGLGMMNKYLRQAKANTILISRLNNNQPPYSLIYFETIKGEKIVYYQDTTKLYQVVSKSTSVVHKDLLSDNLQTISFAYPKTDDDSIIHISICLVKIPHPYIKGAKALQLSVEKVRIMN
jgi:prepilin-type N-terminal cleavage/methylation domain-containing protein